jgi:hypothetical protein
MQGYLIRGVYFLSMKSRVKPSENVTGATHVAPFQTARFPLSHSHNNKRSPVTSQIRPRTRCEWAVRAARNCPGMMAEIRLAVAAQFASASIGANYQDSASRGTIRRGPQREDFQKHLFLGHRSCEIQVLGNQALRRCTGNGLVGRSLVQCIQGFAAHSA